MASTVFAWFPMNSGRQGAKKSVDVVKYLLTNPIRFNLCPHYYYINGSHLNEASTLCHSSGKRQEIMYLHLLLTATAAVGNAMHLLISTTEFRLNSKEISHNR